MAQKLIAIVAAAGLFGLLLYMYGKFPEQRAILIFGAIFASRLKCDSRGE